MKQTFPTLGFLLVVLSAASAQVASHAPTVFNQTPAPAQPAPSPGGKPVARVNGAVLTDADLLREEYAIFPYGRQHNGIPKDLAPQIRQGAMQMLIFEELVYQEAVRRKLTIAPLRLEKSEADFRKQFATPEEFNAFLQSDFHGSQQALEDKIRRSLLIDALLKSEIESRSAVSIAEIRAYYDKNPARFSRPETYTFQTITVIPPDHATAAQLKEAKTRADKALQQAKPTKTNDEFGLLAEKISDDDYRVMEGQHKPMPLDQLAPQALTALKAMKPGDVSDLIQVGPIYTILRLNAHTPAGKQKFEEMQAQLRKELHETKTNQLRAALDKKLRENAKVEEP